MVDSEHGPNLYDLVGLHAGAELQEHARRLAGRGERVLLELHRAALDARKAGDSGQASVFAAAVGNLKAELTADMLQIFSRSSVP